MTMDSNKTVTAYFNLQDICIVSVPSDHWSGEYYDNMTLSGSPVMVRDDGTGFLNFDWGGGSPSTACGVPSDNFSVRWTRSLHFDCGIYRFTATGDDGVRLYVDGQLKIDGWKDQAPTPYTVDVYLSSGNHDIKMEYYQHGWGAMASLSWQSIGGCDGCIASVLSDHWSGEYYDNMTLSGSPVMVRDDGTGFLNFDWGGGSPSTACGVPSDNFSVRWTRSLYFDSGHLSVHGHRG